MTQSLPFHLLLLPGDGTGVEEGLLGSAPDIAGQGTAKPLGAILSFALMLRYSLEAAAEAVLAALDLETDRGGGDRA